MPTPVYLDASALIRRAEASALSVTPRSAHAGSPVTALLLSPLAAVATCEVGLLEFHDVVTRLWRNTALTHKHFDEAWADAVISTTMADIAARRLEVLSIPRRAFEHAMTLVTMATRYYGRKFQVWDAVHLVAATAWATELGRSVELWTTDDDFAGFLAIFPHFCQAVTVRNLDH